MGWWPLAFHVIPNQLYTATDSYLKCYCCLGPSCCMSPRCDCHEAGCRGWWLASGCHLLCSGLGTRKKNVTNTSEIHWNLVLKDMMKHNMRFMLETHASSQNYHPRHSVDRSFLQQGDDSFVRSIKTKKLSLSLLSKPDTKDSALHWELFRPASHLAAQIADDYMERDERNVVREAGMKSWKGA